MHRRAMLETLTGLLASPGGDRVYLYRRLEEDDGQVTDAWHDNRLAVQRGFCHPGKWRVYITSDGLTEDYETAEAVLDAGWSVE